MVTAKMLRGGALVISLIKRFLKCLKIVFVLIVAEIFPIKYYFKGNAENFIIEYQ